jgi:GDP-L-fucose synthase
MKKIFIAGHNGMVGSAIYRRLVDSDCLLITATREELNLLDQTSVYKFFYKHNFNQVFLAAAKVGGIHANNKYPAEFIFENIAIQNNIINAAHLTDVNKLIFLGSSCIYPKFSNQPISEDYLLSGHLEETNEPYAIAKIAGIKMCESYNRQYGRDYRSIMPTNLYGINDNFHPENSHVIPALIRRFHEAKVQNKSSVTVWGSGNPLREFLHVDDMADASIHMMNIEKSILDKFINPMVSHINIGSGKEYKIKSVAEKIASIIGFEGNILWDKSKPDGTPRKLLDISLAQKLGWKPQISFDEGIKETYRWFQENLSNFRAN